VTRRIALFLCALTLLAGVATPALAQNHIVAQRTSKAKPGHVYLGYRLNPGHRYRVDVSSRGHHSFSGFGTEIYQYITNHVLHTGSKSMSLSGVTPHSFTIKQPVSQHLGGWSVAINCQLTDASGLTVRLVDLGKHT
jgi:hypothetical protein